MKNAILMVAAMGMFSGALADSTTVIQPVSVEVKNVCTYGDAYATLAGNPPVNPASDVPGNQTDVNARTYTDGTVQPLGTYQANKATTGNSLSQTYIFRCTKGTAWSKSDHTGTQSIIMKSTSDSSTLIVKATTDESMIADSNNSGDIYQGSAKFNIDAGQYSSTAGHYEGKLTIVISYN